MSEGWSEGEREGRVREKEGEKGREGGRKGEKEWGRGREGGKIMM